MFRGTDQSMPRAMGMESPCRRLEDALLLQTVSRGLPFPPLTAVADTGKDSSVGLMVSGRISWKEKGMGFPEHVPPKVSR